MSLSIDAEVPPLRETEGGVIRIADTRVPLERVVEAFLSGMSPEQIAHSYDVLKIEDIYAVINYYLHHREEVDAYMARAAEEAEQTRREINRQFSSVEIRARLISRFQS